MRSIWAAALLLRRLRAELGIVLLIFALVGATSLVFAAAPRLFNRVSDDALEHAVRSASPSQRNIALVMTGSVDPAKAPGVEGVRAHGERLSNSFPASVRSLVSERSLGVTSVRFYLPDPPSYDTYLTLRYRDGVTDATRLMAGRWPVDRGYPLRELPLTGSDEPPDAPPDVFEAALSAETAAEIGAKLGDRLRVTLDGSDPLVRGTPRLLAKTEIEIVGLYDPLDAESEYWAGETALLRPIRGGTEEAPIAYATGVIAAEQYPNLWASTLPFRYDWLFLVEAGRMSADQVALLQSDLRRIGRLGSAGQATAAGSVTVLTGLPGILDRYVIERALAESILSIAAIGPFGLAAGAMAMIAILLVRQRRAAIALARGRGASGSVVLGTQLWEAVLLAGAAAMLGLLAATVLVPARASPVSSTLAIAVSVVAALLLVGASWSIARRPLGQVERDDAPILRVPPRRLVIEATIVAVAVAAALLLRQRGLTIGEAGKGGVVRVDPLLASVPVLSGLAAGIVVARLYPLPIRALGWLAARRRDLVPVLGLRTIGRHPAAANLPLLALMLTAAFGAFASIVASTLERGQVAASYLEVGSDYRVERIGNNSLALIDPSRVAGVEAVAGGLVDSSAAFATSIRQRASIYFLAMEPTSYEAVTSGTAAEPAWPVEFLDEPPDGAGTDVEPIPAILSNKLPAGTPGLQPGDIFHATVVGRSLTFRLVEQRATFAGVDERVAFTVAPFNWIRAAIPEAPPPPSTYWLRGSGPTAEGLAAMVSDPPGAARIISRYTSYTVLHDAPFSIGIVAGFALAVIIAAVYMAFTIVGALILSSARRTQDLAYLRTLGVTGPQALLLTIMEHAPPVLLALIPGVALGIGIAMLTEPGLGLATFVGTDRAVPLSVDVAVLASVVAGLIGIVVVAVATGTWLSRRAALVNALRIGEH